MRDSYPKVLQVQTLQEDLRQSNNQLREVQTGVEVLQAKILSNSPSVSFARSF